VDGQVREYLRGARLFDLSGFVALPENVQLLLSKMRVHAPVLVHNAVVDLLHARRGVEAAGRVVL